MQLKKKYIYIYIATGDCTTPEIRPVALMPLEKPGSAVIDFHSVSSFEWAPTASNFRAISGERFSSICHHGFGD